MKSITKISKIIRILLILTLISATSTLALADTQPQVPCVIYGEVYIGDDLAPVGTEIVAKIDGDIRAEIIITSEGNYALTVEGNEGDIGKVITIYVNDMEASSTVTWDSPKDVQLDLKVDAQTSSSSNINSGSSSSVTHSTSSDTTDKIESESLEEDEVSVSEEEGKTTDESHEDDSIEGPAEDLSSEQGEDASGFGILLAVGSILLVNLLKKKEVR